MTTNRGAPGYRTTQSLDGLWTIIPLDQDRKSCAALVPGTWQSIPSLTGFRGQADYIRQVNVERGSALLLRFGGVSHTADVYWDDVQAGHHYNAYTAFDVLIPWAQRGTHTLRVRVDNSWSEHSTLHIPNDYYTYGGITRPTELHYLTRAYVKELSFRSRENVDGTYTASVKAQVCALQPLHGAAVNVSVADQLHSIHLPDLSAGMTYMASAEIPVGHVQEWDVLQPALYDLKVTLQEQGTMLDDLVERVGFLQPVSALVF